MLTPANPRPPERLRFAIDNGAWTAFQQKTPFDGDAFWDLAERYGCAADFVVCPDIVAGGMESLAFSVSWMPKMRHFKQILLPVQDGMEASEVGKILRERRNVGIFLGGTTEYKLREMYGWGMVAASWRRWYHVGRVNSMRRIRLCAEAGATSFDGTSATMYSCNVPMLTAARNQPSLLCP
jgi:hypothetical protein